MTEQTTGGRDELSRTLRRLRQAAGLPGAEVGRLAGFSQAKVSRIENGVNVPTPDDVMTLTQVYNGSAMDRRHLETMARDVRAEYRRVVLVKTPSDFQERMGRIEQASEHIATFTPTVVPGLLQTEPYARAIFSSADLAPSEIDKAVAARTTRQQLLHDPGHRFTLITTAGALAWRADTPELMAAQIEHIAESTRLPNARVGIIPWGAQARSALIQCVAWQAAPTVRLHRRCRSPTWDRGLASTCRRLPAGATGRWDCWVSSAGTLLRDP